MIACEGISAHGVWGMDRLFLLLPLWFLLNSCATCWRDGEPLRDVEVRALRAVEKDLRGRKDVQLFRGLAHPQRDEEIYKRQLMEEDHIEIEGFRFFRQAEAVDDACVKRLVNLYCDKESHQALAAPKTTCAGFHPDYALVWRDKGRKGVLQICYGCHEWKYLGAGGILYTDINEPAYFDELMQWLPPR